MEDQLHFNPSLAFKNFKVFFSAERKSTGKAGSGPIIESCVLELFQIPILVQIQPHECGLQFLHLAISQS